MTNMLLITLAALLLSCSDNTDGQQNEIGSMDTGNRFFSRTSRISDVIADPAFGDYGRLIFPVQTGYWSGNTLEQLRLTYL